MTCKYRHNLQLVNNHYDDDGNPDIESFSGGYWKQERACEDCDYTLEAINK